MLVEPNRPALKTLRGFELPDCPDITSLAPTYLRRGEIAVLQAPLCKLDQDWSGP